MLKLHATRRAVLAKFYIGDVALKAEEELDIPSLEDELAEGTFYAVLKQRVQAFMQAHQVTRTIR